MASNALARVLLTVCLAAGTLAGCAEGPRGARLSKVLQARLDASFGKGLFELVRLKRKGHYPLPKTAAGSARVLVYYSANVRFLRAHRLAAWNQLNIGSLVSVLGATPQGVRGVEPRGNKQGDVLEVRGAVAWVKAPPAKAPLDKAQPGGWQPTAFTPAKKTSRKQGPGGEELPYRKRLAHLARLGRALQKARKDPKLADLTGELDVLIARTERRLGQAKGIVTLATGRPGGEYDRQGRALVGLLRGAKVSAQAYQTAGSSENCRLVAAGEVLFAYTQNDIAAQASSGEGRFAGAKLAGLRALCSLYPEALQVVVLARSGAKDLRSLAGKRIDIGPRGSGTRVNARALIAAAGLTESRFSAVRDRGLPSALGDLERGQVDAVFITSAFPNVALRELAARTKIDLLDLDVALRAALQQAQPHLLPLVIPAKTYPGMLGPRRTVGATAMLITRQDVPAARVESLLSRLFAGVAQLSRGSVQAYFISPKTALKGISIPLHPAAKRYFAR